MKVTAWRLQGELEKMSLFKTSTDYTLQRTNSSEEHERHTEGKLTILCEKLERLS